LKIPTPSGDVSVALEGSSHPKQLVLLAHGAGGSMDTDFMRFFASGLADDTRAVARFNFPYMEQGRKSPGTPKASEGAFFAVAEALATKLSPKVMFVGGKSYGGRIASHVVAQGLPADGLLFLGYPLHPPGKPERIRDEHLKTITCPMLFVEGTRDPFCPLETLASVRDELPAPTDVLVVEDGDHSLKVRRTSGRTTEDAWRDACAGIDRWLSSR
jgi:uncharacterized protein